MSAFPRRWEEFATPVGGRDLRPSPDQCLLADAIPGAGAGFKSSRKSQRRRPTTGRSPVEAADLAAIRHDAPFGRRSAALSQSLILPSAWRCASAMSRAGIQAAEDIRGRLMRKHTGY